MSGELVVRGARDNNLKDVSVTLQKGRLTVFCGRSGSGKSSLAFDTLHREGQRRYLEALLQRTASLKRPDVESITGLPPTIALDQRERSASSRQTVAGLCELEVGLAVLFGRTGRAHCPACGRPIVPVSLDAIVARILELPQGTRLTLEAPLNVKPGVLEEVVRSGFSRVRVGTEVRRIEEIRELPEDSEVTLVVDRVKVDPAKRSRIHDGVRLASRAGRGVVLAVHASTDVFVDRPLCIHDGIELPPLQPGRFRLDAQAEHFGLDSGAQVVEVGGLRLETLLEGTVAELASTLASMEPDAVTQSVLDDLKHRCSVLEKLGLGTLPLGRPSSEASRGEQVRLRLARQVSSRVSGVLYVLDEPASGLDDDSATAVVRTLETLVEQGNTVVAVDHHPALIRAAHEIVEFGPGAGPEGGTLVFQGYPSDLGDTATGRVLRGEVQTEPFVGQWVPHTLAGCTLHKGGLTVLAGPSGAGKSRALARLADAGKDVYDRVVSATSTALTRSKRSTPATFVGFWSVMRDLLSQTQGAKVQGLSASVFSLNTKGGRCESCKGEGEVRMVLDPLPDVWVGCDVCHGRRFQQDVLEVRWKAHAADEILDLTVAEALPLLAGHPKLARMLRSLSDVGLGHIQLGRRTDTLSGGEIRRLKLARELARGRAIGLILADDPSLGLHPVDTVDLMRAFQQLAYAGHTVVLASCDPWVAAGASQVVPVGGTLDP